MSHSTLEPNDRRQGPDFWAKYVRVAGVLVWGFIFIIFLLIERAQPRSETFFDRLLSVNVSVTWNTYFLTIVVFLSLAQLIFATVSVIINLTRHRRKTDKLSKSLLIATFISIVIIAFSLSKLL